MIIIIEYNLISFLFGRVICQKTAKATSSIEGRTAVHAQVVEGDVPGTVRQQEDHGVGDQADDHDAAAALRGHPLRHRPGDHELSARVGVHACVPVGIGLGQCRAYPENAGRMRQVRDRAEVAFDGCDGGFDLGPAAQRHR